MNMKNGNQVFCHRCGTRHAVGVRCPGCGKETDAKDPLAPAKAGGTPGGRRPTYDGGARSLRDEQGWQPQPKDDPDFEDDPDAEEEGGELADSDVDEQGYSGGEDEAEASGGERARAAAMDKIWKVFVTILILVGVGVLVFTVPNWIAKAVGIGIGFPLLRSVWK